MHPLTSGQRGLWFAEQMDPGSTAYNDGISVRLRGRLDIRALAKSVAALAARHDSLRAVFSSEHGEPVQAVQDRWAGNVTVTHAVGQPDRDTAAREFAEVSLSRPFDLTAGPVFRAELLQFDAEDWVLVLAIHHLVLDGWSTGVLLRELSVLYSAQLNGEHPGLVPLPRTYADFVNEQQRQLSAPAVAESLDYWLAQVAGTQDRMDRMLLDPESAVRQNSKYHEFEIPASLTEGVRALARRARATAFMTLLSAFEVLLSQATGEDDFLLGVPTADRPAPEFAGVVGYFVNVLPFRANVREDQTCPDLTVLGLLERVRTTTLSSLAFADLPFELLVERLNPKREPGVNPLVQISFQYYEQRLTGNLTLPGIDATAFQVLNRPTPFLLSLDVFGERDRMTGRLVYREAMLTPGEVTAFTDAYLALLREFTTNPDAPLSRLPVTAPRLGPEHRQASADGASTAPMAPPTQFMVPRPGAEELVAGVMASVLGVDRLGRDDDFFQMGGHSLPAVQVVARVRELFGASVSVRSLFEHPTVAGFAGVATGAGGQALAPVGLLPAGARPLASFAQQRLWFIQELDPGSTAYSIGRAYRLRGRLDLDALSDAIDQVVSRQQALRTRFRVVNGAVEQVVDPVWDSAVTVHDLNPAGTGELVTQALLGARAGELLARPFDLAAGPLFRVDLLRLADTDHVLVLGMHHVVCDGWSAGILLKELAAAYNAALRDEVADLPALPVTYVDFAHWQRDQLNQPAMDKQLDYWLSHIAGAPQVLSLLEQPTGEAQSSVERTFTFTVPAEVTLALRELSQRAGVTLFMTLLAVFEVVLSRVSGQTDLLVGVPVAGRTTAQVEDVVGFFVNLLTFRADLRTDPTFEQLLQRTRTTTINGLANADLQFERLVQKANPDRTPTINPLVQVAFQLFEERLPDLDLAGLRADVVDSRIEDRNTDLPLAMDVHCLEDGLAVVLTCNVMLVKESAAAWLAELFPALLRSVTRFPNCRIGELPFLDSRGSRIVAPAPPPAVSSAGRDVTPGVMAAFWRTVENRGTAVAIADPDGPWSFAELGRAVLAIAARLAGRGERIAIAAHRSKHLVAGLLAVMEAGAVAVPVDLADPPGRIRHVLHLADVTAALVDEAGARVVGRDGIPLILPGDDRGDAAASRRSADTAPPTAAVLLFTSGSTGQPKGVILEHGALANLLAAHRGVRFGGDRRRVAFSASVAFDAAWDQLLWLVDGHELYVLGDDERRDTPALLDIVRSRRIDVLDAPPSQVSLLLDLGLLTDPRHPKMLIMGGQAIAPSLWRRLHSARADVEAWNFYGPTECTIDALTCRIGDRAQPSIGWPIDGTHARILDDAGEAVPVGVVGEIYLGGAHVGRGYLGQPTLTAERFVPDPWSCVPGARMYRTGDLGRVAADGAIEFLGRIDTQLKIRGYRVEPGEVDAALLEHPEISDAATTYVAAPSQDPWSQDLQLCAYVVSRIPVTSVRDHLTAKLPSYMIPGYIVPVSAIPRMTSGKLDRHTLPDPVSAAPSGKFVVPRPGAEELVAGVMASVLGVDRLGRDDDFFQMGGHSLKAGQVVARVRELFGASVSVRSLFEHPTVAGFAGVATGAGGQALAPVGLLPAGARPLASFAQQRLWFIQELDPGSTAYSIGEAYRLRGRLDLDALSDAIDQVVSRQQALRTRFRVVNGAVEQVVDPVWDSAVTVHDLNPAGTGELVTQALLGARAGELLARPFDLAAGPLFRVDLLRLADTDHVLVLGMHHVVCDGWSAGILLKELAAAYNAALRDEVADLPALPVTYVDFAHWQRDQLNQPAMDKQLDYWLSHIAGAPQIIDWPGGRRTQPDDAIATPVPFNFTRLETAALRELSQRAGVTLFMTLLAVFEVVLSRVSGQTDLLVGVPVAGRTTAQVEDVVGFFVNLLTFRADLRTDPTFEQLLQRTRTTTINGLANADLQFERLVQKANPDRTPTINPLVQVAFQLFEEEAERDLGMTGLSSEQLAAEMRGSRFDLTVDVYQRGDGLSGWFYFDPGVFDLADVKRIADLMTAVARHALANPQARTTEIGTGPSNEVHYEPEVHEEQVPEAPLPGWSGFTVGGQHVAVRSVAEPTGRCRLWPSVGEYPVYDDFLYHAMLEDQERNRRFSSAVETLAPGARVVEYGSGPDLLWSARAAESGAARVVAVESDEDSADRARQFAQTLTGTPIEVVTGSAVEVDLDMRADLCIAELVGSIAGSEGIAAVIGQAWRRHMTPGAQIIPSWTGTRIAAVGLADLLAGPPALAADYVHYVQAVMRSVGSVFDMRFCVTGLTRSDLMTSDSLVEDLRLAADSYEYPENVELTVRRPGRIDGLLLWLQLQCAPGQDLLDSLDQQTNWLPVYVPFDLDEPVDADSADRIFLTVGVHAVDGTHPEYDFRGALFRPDGQRVDLHGHSAYAAGPFRQSWLHRALFRR